ncbi:MAG: MBL fold metallo-hydrolase [Clostridia bacterium]|nr:MBL fold metallo-hydrolase [Clostridia bacterium]
MEQQEKEMIITTLVEDGQAQGFESEHGLSLYLQTPKHKILFDAGQSDLFLTNAEKLGVNIAEVDVAVLSHGHYDHGGGLKTFLQKNARATVYINASAFGEYYNGDKYIGLDNDLLKSPRVRLTDGEFVIDEELALLTMPETVYPVLSHGLTKRQGRDVLPDDFAHEHYLSVRVGEKRVLFSGCSHRGALNIMAKFAPDVFVGGFHFIKYATDGEDKTTLEDTAKRLLSYPTEYYTGHCTGNEQYALLKSTMGNRLHRLTIGKTFTINNKKPMQKRN